MELKTAIQSVPDDELLRRLGELVSHSRRVEVDLVSHIGEVEARGLYAREAFPSMFAYCTGALHLSEAEAYLRITVARAAREHPPLLTMLGDGRLHLSGIVKILPVLTQQNRDRLLERATHLSKRQIVELVAELSPRPDVPSVIRRLPQRPTPALTQPIRSGKNCFELGPDRVDGLPTPIEAPDPVLGGSAALELGPDGVDGFPDRLGPSPAQTALPDSTRQAHAQAADVVALPSSRSASSRAPAQRAVVEPLSPDRYKVQFTASRELRDKLERLTALMRAQVPDGDLAAIIEAAVTEKLERIVARRYATTSAPRKELADSDTSPASRHIPAAVRRAVRERDGNRCRYTDERGRRCPERDRLEFHHLHPFGMGGDHSLGNLRLLCPTHNRYLAEVDYGRAAIGRRSTRREAPAQPSAGGPGG